MGLFLGSLLIGLAAGAIKGAYAGKAAESEAEEAIKEANQEAANATAQAATAYANAQIARDNADRALEVGAQDAARLQKQGTQQLGRNIVGQATSAFATTTGSAKGLQQDFTAGVQQDVNQTLENAQFEYEQSVAEADIFEDQAGAFEDQATFFEERAESIDPEEIRSDTFWSNVFGGAAGGASAGVGYL